MGDERGRKSVYLIKSPLFRFWFRHVYPNIGLLERGEYGCILAEVKRTFNSFVGMGFERVCVEALEEMNRRNELPFGFESIGPYWGKLRRGDEREEFEIDAVALNGETNEIMFVECKWQDNWMQSGFCTSSGKSRVLWSGRRGGERSIMRYLQKASKKRWRSQN